MAHIVQPDLFDPREFRRRPGVLRRVARRYQVLELAVIIGGILLLWGASSLDRVHATLLDRPLGWLDSMQIGANGDEAIRGDSPGIGRNRAP